MPLDLQSFTGAMMLLLSLGPHPQFGEQFSTPGSLEDLLTGTIMVPTTWLSEMLMVFLYNWHSLQDLSSFDWETCVFQQFHISFSP